MYSQLDASSLRRLLHLSSSNVDLSSAPMLSPRRAQRVPRRTLRASLWHKLHRISTGRLLLYIPHHVSSIHRSVLTSRRGSCHLIMGESPIQSAAEAPQALRHESWVDVQSRGNCPSASTRCTLSLAPRVALVEDPRRLRKAALNSLRTSAGCNQLRGGRGPAGARKRH